MAGWQCHWGHRGGGGGGQKIDHCVVALAPGVVGGRVAQLVDYEGRRVVAEERLDEGRGARVGSPVEGRAAVHVLHVEGRPRDVGQEPLAGRGVVEQARVVQQRHPGQVLHHQQPLTRRPIAQLLHHAPGVRRVGMRSRAMYEKRVAYLMRASRFLRSEAEVEAQHAGSSSTLFRTCTRVAE